MKALLIVDIQNDFLPGGALGVKDGDKVIPVVNALMEKDFDYVVGSKDWHTPDHVSFAKTHGKKPGEKVVLPSGEEQILWPVHCVQGTHGAAFHENFHWQDLDAVFLKGIDHEIDSYSAIFDNGKKRSTGLDAFLKKRHVDKLYIAGIATDYCVKYSTMDALSLGLQVYVVVDGCRGVDVSPGDVEKALVEMRTAGAKIVTSQEV